MVLRQILRFFGLVEEVIAVALLIAMTAITLIQVACRYLMTNPFIWTEEVTRLTLIWMAFVAAAAVTRRGLHLAVDAGLNAMPLRARRITQTLVHVLLALLFAWIAYICVTLAHKIGTLPLAATRWPMSVMVWPTAAGCALIAFHSALHALAGAGLIPSLTGDGEESEVIRT